MMSSDCAMRLSWWVHCAHTHDVHASFGALFNINPVFTRTLSLMSSCLCQHWHISLECKAFFSLLRSHFAAFRFSWLHRRRASNTRSPLYAVPPHLPLFPFTVYRSLFLHMRIFAHEPVRFAFTVCTSRANVCRTAHHVINTLRLKN